MREFLLAALLFSIVCLIMESVIVFRNLKTRLHAFLFLNCIFTIVNNTGYLAELCSSTEEGYLSALKFSYLGRVFIAYILILFTAELCHVKIPAIVSGSLFLFNLVTYSLIFTVEYHPLYYRERFFSMKDHFPIFLHSNGCVHYVYVQLQLAYIVTALFWLLRATKRSKSCIARKRFLIIVLGYTLESVFFIIQISHILPVTHYFDISIFGNFVVTLSMFIAIFRYNLLGVIDIARDYIIDNLAEGVIAVDPAEHVQYFNKHAKLLYPELSRDPEGVLQNVRASIQNNATLRHNDHYYTLEENDLHGDGEYIGKLYALVDTTVLKQQEYKLQSDREILEMAAKRMQERLETTEQLMQQDKAMRHDRRHFEALLLSLLNDGKLDDARRCLEERLAQEPRSCMRYCENATVNAALTHYIALAEEKNIPVQVSTNIPFSPGVDEMQLAIAISNLLENAIHACEQLPEEERFIEITAKFKSQLLLEIVNACPGTVPLDEEQHPYNTEDGHGVGTRSVLQFIRDTDSDIRYIAEDGKFRVRLIVG